MVAMICNRSVKRYGPYLQSYNCNFRASDATGRLYIYMYAFITDIIIAFYGGARDYDGQIFRHFRLWLLATGLKKKDWHIVKQKTLPNIARNDLLNDRGYKSISFAYIDLIRKRDNAIEARQRFQNSWQSSHVAAIDTCICIISQTIKQKFMRLMKFTEVIERKQPIVGFVLRILYSDLYTQIFTLYTTKVIFIDRLQSYR